MQLTPEELVREFQDAVLELYFARKRIVLLEEENAGLRAHLAAALQPGSRPDDREPAPAAGQDAGQDAGQPQASG
ncbi:MULTISPECIES: hypothetical protein [Kitasatospora]|uniref:Transposase n=1 Tax=Kitasatospora setae (strain ATCC 33774 / DSM 43861 / JCM 3304 / KCC A-0304 / NBRC 14216 / KM-6054) TaxID=452652 RepID=E4NII0_KITSK|nr:MULTISPECIES: hypothetical protein [Kitasatospora]BAJ31310.1 hypothetical protein KSE_55350 [Kitasatospora setae KM-6054]